MGIGRESAASAGIACGATAKGYRKEPVVSAKKDQDIWLSIRRKSTEYGYASKYRLLYWSDISFPLGVAELAVRIAA
jgi:hypothetical protein